MRRTQGGAEARLHNRYTLGAGGHINPEDVGENPALDGLRPGWPGRNLAAG